jgi:hypothetical protein
MPRKQSKDSIISYENVKAALERAEDFDISSVSMLPCILMCDPAWTGGDETVIWYKQGNYARLLDRFKLDKSQGQDHMYTYLKMVKWEQELGIDAVFIDQGEGTAIKTLANNAGKNWELVSFANSPNDTAEFKDSEYANIRAQMYYEGNKWLMNGGVLDAREPEWKEDIQKQLCWTKGGRHKVHNKKLAEAKIDIKNRVGQSPDVADGFVLGFARLVPERLPENDRYGGDDRMVGGQAFQMPDHNDPYTDVMDVEYRDLYR